MIIHVTAKHIRNGRKEVKPDNGMYYPNCNSGLCPVAKAIHETSGDYSVRVYDIEIVRGHSIDIKNPRAHYPRSVARFVKAFDAGKKVKPFRFRLVWK